MYFADFYHDSRHQMMACGDRSVYILDGRNSLDTMIEDAREWGRKYGFKSYKLCRGDTFCRSSSFFKGRV